MSSCWVWVGSPRGWPPVRGIIGQPGGPWQPQRPRRRHRMSAPLLLINAVGLTPRLLPHAPRLNALASAGWVRPLREVLPAVTCTAQATMLTGETAGQHGVVGNGWL